MVRIVPLVGSELNADFLHIAMTGSPQKEFAYYVLDTLPDTPLGSRNYWDIIGVRLSHTGSGHVDLRLLHIDEEWLESDREPRFDALNDAPGFVTVSPAGFVAVKNLIESWKPVPSVSRKSRGAYFGLLGRDAFAELGIPSDAESRFVFSHASVYQYAPDVEDQVRGHVSLLIIWQWSSMKRDTARLSLQVTTFHAPAAGAGAMNPLVTTGLGAMRLSPQAIDELVGILTRHQFADR
jgi:hypothetical protein